jgi:hypothetical protein
MIFADTQYDFDHRRERHSGKHNNAPSYWLQFDMAKGHSHHPFSATRTVEQKSKLASEYGRNPVTKSTPSERHMLYFFTGRSDRLRFGCHRVLSGSRVDWERHAQSPLALLQERVVQLL